MNRAKYVYPNIMAEMGRNGDNLRTLAQKLGMGYQALSARLRGTKNFELPEIYKLMRLYNCKFDTLFMKD